MLNAVDSRFPELADVARDYCDLIDHLDDVDARDLLAQVACLLPRLHAAVVALPRVCVDGPVAQAVDLETRFALYRRLREKLGVCDAYWMLYDLEPAMRNKSGSLADDLTDIYFDLRRGLAHIEGGSPFACARAVWDWSRTYEVHWGEHLVDAERHLYHLMRAR